MNNKVEKNVLCAAPTTLWSHIFRIRFLYFHFYFLDSLFRLEVRYIIVLTAVATLKKEIWQNNDVDKNDFIAIGFGGKFGNE